MKHDEYEDKESWGYPNTLGEQYLYTPDLALVAYLLCVGYEVFKLDKSDPKRVQFVIHEDLHISDNIRDFWNGTAAVDPLKYFNNLKLLKNQIYSSINN